MQSFIKKHLHHAAFYKAIMMQYKTISYPEINTEIRISINDSIQNMVGQQEVLIIGGGPSTNTIDFDDFKDTPKWTMNNFFLNDTIKDLDIQLITLLDDVDIDNPLLWEYVSKSNPLIIQEISDFGYQRIKKIKNYHNNMTCMLTRYRSRLGVGARLIVLAIMLGIQDIYFCGFDGLDPKTKDNHSFEKNKSLQLGFKMVKITARTILVFWRIFYNYKLWFQIIDLTKGVESVQCNYTSVNEPYVKYNNTITIKY